MLIVTLCDECFLAKIASLTHFANLRIHLKRAIEDHTNIPSGRSWWNVDVPNCYGLNVDIFGIV